MLILYELKKQLEQPFAYIFLAICFAVNIFLCNNSYTNNVIKSQSELVSETGTFYMTEEIAQSIEDTSARSLTLQYVGRSLSPEDAKEILLDCSMFGRYRFDEDFSEHIAEISSERLAKRLEEVAEKDELSAINGGGELFWVLSSIVWAVAIESVIFSLLMTAKILGHEAVSQTASVVLSTRTGRRINLVKAAASVIVSIAFQAVNFLLCCGLFFALCPCFNLLSAPFVLDYPAVIPWLQTTVGAYFMLNFLMSLLLTTIFTLMSFCCSGKNGGISQFFLSLILAFILYIPAFFKLGFISPFFRCLTPTALLFNQPGSWFSVSQSGIAVFGADIFAMIFWAAVCVVGSVFAYKKFKKSPL